MKREDTTSTTIAFVNSKGIPTEATQKDSHGNSSTIRPYSCWFREIFWNLGERNNHLGKLWSLIQDLSKMKKDETIALSREAVTSSPNTNDVPKEISTDIPTSEKDTKINSSTLPPYSCWYCPYTCTQKSHLTTHQLVHTGEKRYTCTHCLTPFVRLEDLKRHQRSHTGIFCFQLEEKIVVKFSISCPK